MVSRRKQRYDTDLLVIGFLAFFVAAASLYFNNFSLEANGMHPFSVYISTIVGIAMLAKGFNVVS